MMLTTKQPSSYGYKSVHDLPTPPSTSRPSPPLAYQADVYHASQPSSHRIHSPTSRPMSTPHRGLPPPAAMALPPQPASHQPPPAAAGPPPHHSHAPPVTSSQQPAGSWTTLPAPPQHWHGAEDTMKNWLQARAEEEKTRQEEERTRQESLRLEQRRIEMDILRASLGGGIPPPMVPLVFAGMGTGIMPQAAFDWAQQFMQTSQGHQPPALPGLPQHAEHQRESSGSSAYAPAGSSQGGPARYGSYPGSPIRARGQTVSGPPGRSAAGGAGLGSINTGIGQSASHPLSAMPLGQQGGGQGQVHGSQQEASPSIYFHHWQPPTSQSGGTNRPASPSGETSKKRKATGQPDTGPVPGQQPRFRTPPPLSQAGTPNASPGKRGHRRQRSDMSWHPSMRQSFAEGEVGAGMERSPEYQHERAVARTPYPDSDNSEPKKHSVSSMLAGEPLHSGTTPFLPRTGSPSR